MNALQCSFDDVLQVLSNERFDLITSSYAVYYASDMLRLIAGLRDLALEDGRVFVCGPGRGTNQEMTDLVRC